MRNNSGLFAKFAYSGLQASRHFHNHNTSMNKNLLVFFSVLALSFTTAHPESAIRVNQVGYLPGDVKVAVFISHTECDIIDFNVTDTVSGLSITLTSVKDCGEFPPFASTYRLDFSSITTPGVYTVSANGTTSPAFKISDDAYVGTNEMPLKYMRQQRCGFNPLLGDSCHTHDGRLVLNGDNDGTVVDVTGGWHDASDYLQYLTTSANATYQMLFAYSRNPEVWADEYLENGMPGSNGVPDILDEARWGLEWMLKMNPNDSTFYNQIADDRDHRFAGMPNLDNVDYGWGEGVERPVYPCIGRPCGLSKYKNRSTGTASSVAKFSSAFLLASEIFAGSDSTFAALLRQKGENAYRVAQANPGVCQTNSTVSPYFYEEDNWSDDLELAASQLYRATGDRKILREAVDYGRLEPVTPWMGADSARHYQWYPFINMGHVNLAMTDNQKVCEEFLRNLRSGLRRVADRAGSNPFMNGIPFIWCSNNLTVAFVTQAMLYRQISGDNTFLEIETAMRDWLFGANPWGKCMVIGLPDDGDYPKDPHSAFTDKGGYRIDGGLVDGPVYESIYNSLWGIHLRNNDIYAPFQNVAVYHDDYCDYSTNEPTMDGTASLTFMLGVLASEAKR